MANMDKKKKKVAIFMSNLAKTDLHFLQLQVPINLNLSLISFHFQNSAPNHTGTTTRTTLTKKKTPNHILVLQEI